MKHVKNAGNRHAGSMLPWLMALVMVLTTATAQAQFDRRIYLGGGIGVSMIEPEPNDTGYENDETSDTGFRLYLGWDFSERFSFEGYYASLGEATLVQGAGQTLTPPDGSVSYSTYGVSALYHLFNTQGSTGRMDRTGISVFGKGGFGALDTNSDDLDITPLEDFHLMLGFGAEMGFNNGLALRADYDFFDTDAHLLSVGLLWRFGKSDSYVPPPLPPKPEVKVEKLPEPELAVDTAPSDSDYDGVADAVDNCPGSPPGVVVDADGCPLFDGELQGVNFESGSAQLTADSMRILDGVVSDLQQFPDVRVAVAAHTDNQGDAKANLQLSKDRALSVARYLVSRGISANRLRPEAYGESQPLVSNATAEGRAQNRRVELRTLQ